jgi:hypothetical protein
MDDAPCSVTKCHAKAECDPYFGEIFAYFDFEKKAIAIAICSQSTPPSKRSVGIHHLAVIGWITSEAQPASTRITLDSECDPPW